MSDTKTDPTEQPRSAVEKLFDPAWAERYVDVLAKLSAAAKEFGPDAFKHVMEVERQRIELESKARTAEARVGADIKLETMQRENDLWLARYKMRPRFEISGREIIITICVFAILAISIWKG